MSAPKAYDHGMTDIGREVMTPAEAAKELHVGVKSIRHWLDSGELEGFTTPGGHARIFTDSVQKIKSNRR